MSKVREEYAASLRLWEDYEREVRLARGCTDPIGKVEHEGRAETFLRRYEASTQPKETGHD